MTDRIPDTERPAPLDLAAIEARANAATPGPWRVRPSLSLDVDVESAGHGNDGYPALLCELHYEGDSRPNAAFIAAARTDVPALVAEVRRLTADRDAWKLLAEARSEFLTAYRTGRPPPDSTYDKLTRASDVLGRDVLT